MAYRATWHTDKIHSADSVDTATNVVYDANLFIYGFRNSNKIKAKYVNDVIYPTVIRIYLILILCYAILNTYAV